MGVYIGLSINGAKIHNESWIQAYNESLVLLNSYNFMDIVQENLQGKNILLYEKAKEKIDEKGNKYWKTCGDLYSFESAESFYLYSSINRYAYGKGESEDILIDYCSNNCEENSKVFYAKTQGKDYHIYILAIACLIESKFPAAAIAYGDFTKGEAERAISWANKILKEPIKLPIITRGEGLAKRLQELNIPNEIALKYFMNAVVKDLEPIDNNQLQFHFSKEVIKNYYIDEFNSYNSLSQLGAKKLLIEYLNRNGDLKELCDIIATSQIEITEKEFIKVLCRLNLFIDKSEREIYSFFKHDTSKPTNVYNQFTGLFLDINLQERNLDRYIPIDEGILIFKEKFCELDNIRDLVKETNEEAKNKLKEIISQLEAIIEEYTGNEGDSCITDIESLKFWKNGEVISDTILNFMNKIKDFIKMKLIEDEDKMKILLKENYISILINIISHQNICLSKEIWNLINEIKFHSEDIEAMKKLIFFYSIEETENIRKIHKSASVNYDLLNWFIY